MTIEEKEVVERLNELSEREQIALLMRNAIEQEWDIQAGDNKHNFHINFGKTHILRQEFFDYKNYHITLWSVWDEEKRAYGKFGDMFFLFLELMKK